MESAEIIGHVIGLLIGIVMGLIGGGGSVLLPVFFYLFGKDIELSTAYTLILVGTTAAVGVWLRLGRKEIDVGTAITLALPILAGTLIVRGWLIYVIPEHLVEIGGFVVTKRLFVLLLFSLVLFLSFASIKGIIGKNLKPRPDMRKEHPLQYYGLLISCGLGIGLLSGFIGAGGGVMIVPLLVVVMGLPIKTVVGTSLAIMAFKSIVGFSGDIYQNGSKIEWWFLLGFGLVMMLGIYIGSMMSRRIHAKHLREGFGWFILAMAIMILVKELFFPLPSA